MIMLFYIFVHNVLKYDSIHDGSGAGNNTNKKVCDNGKTQTLKDFTALLRAHLGPVTLKTAKHVREIPAK